MYIAVFDRHGDWPFVVGGRQAV